MTKRMRILKHAWQCACAVMLVVVACMIPAAWQSGSSMIAKPAAQPIEPGPIKAPAVQAQRGGVTGILRSATPIPLEEIRVAVTPVDQSIAFNALESQGLTGFTDPSAHPTAAGAKAQKHAMTTRCVASLMIPLLRIASGGFEPGLRGICHERRALE